ncbi:MAG: PQQ-binding-like beta-propeller repeat protein [Mariniblastus sp.]
MTLGSLPSRRFSRLRAQNRHQFVLPIEIKLGLIAFTLLVWTSVIGQSAIANDWPQINGPARNGTTEGEVLLEKFPAKLKNVWSHPVGQGNSGPIVVGSKLIVFHRPGKMNLVEALNAKTGEVIWNQALPAGSRGAGPDGDLGPKAVPLAHGDHVYVFGSGGNLCCLKLSDGEVVWKKNVLEIYKSPAGYFGSGSSPIVIDDKLLLNVGGRDASVVAFDLKTGDEIWKSFEDRASYSSPIEMTVAGKSAAVFITRLHLLGLSPKDGTVLFKTRFGQTGPTVNGAMPVRIGSHLFINAAYSIGAKWIDVESGTPKIEWANDQSFSSQYSTPVVFNEKLFGSAGREDMGNGSLRCVDPGTGKVLWKQDSVSVGHSILVGGKILHLDCKGGLRVFEANENKYTQLYKTSLFASDARSMPALANGMLYSRSNASRGTGSAELICVQVGESK